MALHYNLNIQVNFKKRESRELGHLFMFVLFFFVEIRENILGLTVNGETEIHCIVFNEYFFLSPSSISLVGNNATIQLFIRYYSISPVSEHWTSHLDIKVQLYFTL